MADDEFLRMKEVEAAVKLSRAQIKKMIRDGKFPNCFKISDKAEAFLGKDIKAFKQCCVDGVAWSQDIT